MSEIRITIKYADEMMGETIKSAIDKGRSYKYVHCRMLQARFRAIDWNTRELPEDQRTAIARNVLIAEQNIAKYAADLYATLNQETVFDDLSEIIEKIDEILKA